MALFVGTDTGGTFTDLVVWVRLRQDSGGVGTMRAGLGEVIDAAGNLAVELTRARRSVQ